MSKALGKRCVWGLCGLLGVVLASAPVTRAEVSTDMSGSVLVFPKVLNDGERDTVIQLTNTSNLLVHVSCFYVNAAPIIPGLPVGPRNPRQCGETDFHLWLTKQQPTSWVVSEGRQLDPQSNSGLDPGAIPPVPVGFEGELRCVQVSASGEPFAGNSLKGEALLRNSNGDVSKYNAVSILATSAASGDNDILLDNTPDTHNGEANSCHDVLLLNHFADGTQDPTLEEMDSALCDDTGGCPITTELTLVPCTIDFENQIPGRVTVQFDITNEYEQHFSASTTVQCWLNEELSSLASVLTANALGTTTAFTRILPVDTDGGVIGVAEEKHSNDEGDSAVAAWDLQAEGVFINGRWLPRTRYDGTLGVPGGPVVDHIVIPELF